MFRVSGLLCRVLRLRFVPTITILLLALGVAGTAFASTCTVTSTADDGSPGTLRACISGASSGDTINFSSTGTIKLTNTLPEIGQDLTIQGPGANLLTISGVNAHTVIWINSGTVNISGLTIANGSAGDGGGIHNRGTLTVTNSIFSDNSAPGGGGAIYNDGTLTVIDSTFLGNSASTGNSGGGAIENVSESPATTATTTVINSTFSGNAADAGGAILNITSPSAFGGPSTVIVISSTFSGNSASTDNGGGAISNQDSGPGATLMVSNSIFTGNSASFGGGINSRGTVSSEGNNLFYNNLGGDAYGFSLSATDVTGKDPMLLPLGSYGGTTQTLLPLSGSPAICAGIPADFPSTSTLISTDQRGFPVNTSCVDAGAVQTNYLTVTSNADSGTGSLRAAMNAANSAVYADIAFSTSLFNSASTTAQDTITLASNLPALTGQINIIGPGALPGGSSTYAIVSGNNSAAVGTVVMVNSGAEVLLDGLSIANGNTTSGNGGGVYNEGTLTVMDSRISGNTAYGGGGILNDGMLTVSDSTISGNSAPQGDGGGIYSEGGALMVTNSTFSRNSASTGEGGGIFSGTTLTVTNSTFSGNSASNGSGGGIFSTDSMAMLTNNTFSGNSTPGTGVGGAIFNNYSSTMTVSNSIFSGDPSSDFGTIVNNSGTLNASNNVFYNNEGGDCAGSCPSITDATSPVLSEALENNGGPTQTFLPLPGSAAICAGSSSLFLSPTGTLLTTDQRGATHSPAYCVAGQVDAGAVQTDYTSIQFANIPSTPVSGAYVAVPSAAPNPAPIVSVTEDGQSIGGVPVTLTDTGSTNSTVTGLGPVSTVAGTGAAFSSLEDTVTEDTTLSATLQITPSFALTTAPTAAFDVAPAPLVTSISPSSGPNTGGTTVTIYGAAFTGATAVDFGGIPSGSVTVVSDSKITATAPAGTGTADVTVTTPYGTSVTLPVDQFTYVPPPAVTGVDPDYGLPAGGTSVTISGNNFTGATAVNFGGTPATNVTIVSNMEITAIAPAGTLGTVDVTVITPGGTSATTTADHFTYAPALVATQAIASATLTQNHAAVPFTPVTGSGGTGELTYSISPDLPAGLLFNVSTGTVSGTPTVAAPATNYTLTVTDTNDGATATAAFTLTVNAAVVATTVIPSTTLTYYQPAAAFTPVTGSGGTGTLSYGISPMLPSGLSFSNSTGTITGPPTVVSAAINYTVTVTDTNGATATSGFSLTVAQQSSQTVVSANPTTATPVQSVTLTATVSPTISGTPVISDGTVTFYDNGTLLMSEPVTGGVAQLVTCLPPGATAVITAVYSGDGNFLGSTSSSSASVVVAPLDFTFTNTGASAYTAAPGAVASYSFGLSPLYGSFAGPVSFTVTGLPAGATASFTPSTVAADTNAATTVTMTVQTAAAIAHNKNNSNSPLGRGVVLALLLLPFGMKRKLREKLRGRMLLLVLLLAGMTVAVTGCGSNNGFMLQSPGTYTLTVTATGGTLQHSQIVTLIVQ